MGAREVRRDGRTRAVGLFCALVLTLSCRRGSRAGGNDELEAARRAAALAWVDALAVGDEALLRRLTADPFIHRSVGRSVGAERPCHGRISGQPAFDEWFECMRATPALRQMAAWWKTFHEARAQSPESAALQRYLPRLVDGDEAWSRFVGADERLHAQGPLDALAKEAGKDGDWVVVSGSWPDTTLVLRLQVVGPAASPQVHAVLVDITR